MNSSKAPKLDFFDLDGFVINLNDALEGLELEIFGEFIPDKPKKDNIELTGKYVLYQPHELPHISYLYNPEGKIGYIFVESGYNMSSDYGGGYEKIILRLNRIDHDLKLKNGKSIRKCGVEFLKEVEESEYPDKDLDKVRKDYLLSWGGFVKAYVDDPAVKRYLRTVLPSEWFSGGGIAKEYRSHEARCNRARNIVHAQEIF